MTQRVEEHMVGDSDDARLVGIPVDLDNQPVDIYSGVARHSGKLWASLHSPAAPTKTLLLVIHPSSNFLGHYLLPVAASLGVAAAGMTTRYIGNDTTLIMENCVLDIASGIRHFRELGYERVILVGNSGGGGLAALYQSQAERPTITRTPAGDPPDLTAADLPPADAVVAFMAHPGRAAVYTNWLDPAITTEADPWQRDPGLDMFDPRNGPPYSAGFLARYRAAQVSRNDRITGWVLSALAADPNDLPFVVHGTCADPRFVDLSIEPDDRMAGTLWGPAQTANLMPASLGHYTSLRSWLSQWSIARSNCDGPAQIGRVSAPVLVLYGTADQACFLSDALSLYDAVTHDRKQLTCIKGATHYFQGQPDLLVQAASQVIGWLREQELA
jgi:pimeloyl-ACP methyl ester carboxylesterase